MFLFITFLFLSCIPFGSSIHAVNHGIEVEEVFFKKNESSRLPEKTSEWIVAPDIILCNHAPIGILDAHKAADWWRIKVGEKFGTVSKGRDAEGCVVGGPKIGKIFIKLATAQVYENNYVGMAKLYKDKNTGYIMWADIELHSVVKERVLEHEIGHALGWSHANISGHIMHPRWESGGWGREGLQ